MRISIAEHPNYPKLEPHQAISLWETAKKNLKVGFEIELNTRDPEHDRINELAAQFILKQIRDAFEAQHGFTMAIGKGACNKKKLKRTFTDGHTRIEVPLEIDIDGYKEHLLVPYGYYDGSTPIELVTSPVEPSVAKIRETFEAIYNVVDTIDTELLPICHNRCGLHQTVVFDHLATMFPETVVANIIQITRAYMPGLFYLLSSGYLGQPTRSLEHRGHNQSIWRRGLNHVSKYSLVYPRNRDTNNVQEYWGIEFRYPDGTQSKVLPGIMAVVNTAIVLKAIKLSQYGALKIPQEYYQKAKVSINKFTSQGQLQSEEYSSTSFFPRIIAEELVQFLSEEITETDKSVLSIIHKLMDKPLWTRFQAYRDMALINYLQIDRELLSTEPACPDKAALDMALAIDSSAATQRRNAIRRLSTRLQKTYAETSQLLEMYGYIWSPKRTRFVLRE